MSTFLSQVNGFTPLIDAVVADAGLNEALVYGMIWRYCRMQDGVCYASNTFSDFVIWPRTVSGV